MALGADGGGGGPHPLAAGVADLHRGAPGLAVVGGGGRHDGVRSPGHAQQPHLGGLQPGDVGPVLEVHRHPSLEGQAAGNLHGL